MAFGGQTLPAAAQPEPRECSGLTTRVILAYVEREGGRGAVREVLSRCGFIDREDELGDENAWVADSVRTRLFDAACAVLDDPLAPQHIGESALDINGGHSLKLALRALGSPKLLYANVPRANGKFNLVHDMELVEIDDHRAQISNLPHEGTPYHPSDCLYNVGMLSSAPRLWGEPEARVTHPQCIADGAEKCIYDVRWTSPARQARTVIGLSLVAGATVGSTALLAPVLLPAATVSAVGAGILGTFFAATRKRKLLEAALQQERDSTELLMDSFQDMTSALRLEEVLVKIAQNARAAVGGAEFALLLDGADGMCCNADSGLPELVVSRLEMWATSTPDLLADPQLVDNVAEVEALKGLHDRDDLRVGSLCSAPLVFRSRAMGVLVALSGAPRGFLPRDVELVRSYASQAAIALTNAHLYEAQEALASRDPLTGLLNHREFHEVLGRELERCRRSGGQVSVAMLDLDDFKRVNDTGGHAEGDRVLRAVADELQGLCRAADSAFRVGGDELALVLPQTNHFQATFLLGRVEEVIGGVDERVGVSCGVATWPESGPGRDALLARADAELYAAKTMGRSGRESAPGENGAGRDLSIAPVSRTDGARRLVAARRLAVRLAPLLDPEQIAAATAEEMHGAFTEVTAMVSRVESPGEIRLLTGAGPLVDDLPDPTSWRQRITDGVVGRTVRSGEPTLISDTRRDPDFIYDAQSTEPRSEIAVPIRVAGEIWGVLNLESSNPGRFDGEDLAFVDVVAAQAGTAIHRGILYGEMEGSLMATIAVFSDALEATDAYTAEHARGVADLAERTAARLGLINDELRDVRYGALLHDIGKIATPHEILIKPGPLSEEELALMREHPVVGARMLKQIPLFSSVHRLVRASHERWDGSGYPDGLAGTDIPVGARIISVCDALHAMISDRPYREGIPLSEALAEIRSCTGSQFDPVAASALLAEIGAGDSRSALVVS